MFGRIYDETFKKFGLSDKVEFTQEEYQALCQQHNGVHELRQKLDEYNELKSNPPRPPIDNSQRIAELEAKKNDIQNRIAVLQQQLTDVENLLAQLGTPTDTTQQLLVSIAAQNKTMLQEKLEELNNQLNDVIAEIERLQQAGLQDQTRYNTELTEYNNELETLRTEIVTLASKLGINVTL